MKEREPRHIARTGQWAVEQLAGRIGQEPQGTQVPHLGDGVAYLIPSDATPRSIAFFEHERVVTVDTPSLHIELFNAAPPRPAKDGIFVEDAARTTRLLFLKTGQVAIEVFPDEPAEPLQSSASHQETASKSDVANMPEEWRIPPPAPPEHSSDIAPGQPSESPVAAEAHERQPRIKVTGFVATEPNIKPTPTGKARVQFLVADHPSVAEGEEEVTVYHRVYTLNNTAARVIERGGLEKGKKVSVDGYLQPRIKKNRKDEDEEYNVVYALNIRTPQASKPFTPKPPMRREPVPKE